MEKDAVLNGALRLASAVTANYRIRYPDSTIGKTADVQVLKKFYKIVIRDVFNGDYSSGSVNAFIDKETGDVYKPKSWKAPAKGVRYNVLTDMDILEEIADFAGGYLYRR